MLYPFLQVVTSCLTRVQYHDQTIDMNTTYPSCPNFTNFICVHLVLYNLSQCRLCIHNHSEDTEQFCHVDSLCYPFKDTVTYCPFPPPPLTRGTSYFALHFYNFVISVTLYKWNHSIIQCVTFLNLLFFTQGNPWRSI